MIRRKSMRTRAIKMLVLDEADEMLNKGFKEQIYDVYRYLPPSTQVNNRISQIMRGKFYRFYKCISFVGRASICHVAARNSGNDEQVHV